MSRGWSVKLRGYFYTLELYTKAGSDPKSLDEAVEAAEHLYGGEWVEVYNGTEAATREGDE